MSSKENRENRKENGPPEAPPAAGGPDLTQLVDANGANLAAFVKAGEAMLAGMTAIGQEMMQFATARVRDSMALSGSVMQCGDPNEAFRLECDFARDATRQYLDEATKLFGLAADLSQRSWAPIEGLTKANLDRLNRS